MYRTFCAALAPGLCVAALILAFVLSSSSDDPYEDCADCTHAESELAWSGFGTCAVYLDKVRVDGEGRFFQPACLLRISIKMSSVLNYLLKISEILHSVQELNLL